MGLEELVFLGGFPLFYSPTEQFSFTWWIFHDGKTEIDTLGWGVGRQNRAAVCAWLALERNQSPSHSQLGAQPPAGFGRRVFNWLLHDQTESPF